MTNLKTLVSIPGWAENFTSGATGNNTIADAKAAYARVPLIFRAARIRANALRKLPLHFRRIGAEVDSDNPFDIDFGDLVWRTEMAMLFRGGAVWLKNKKLMPELGVEVNQGLAWLNPFTVNIKWENKQRLFWQQIGQDRYPANGGFWTDDDIVFIHEFSFEDDVGWGTASADVALGDAQLSFYLRRVASVFFENGAMPVTLAQIAGLSSNPEDPSNKRVSDFLKRSISGIGRFARILAIGNEVKMTTTQSPLKDMIMPELSAETRKHVALAFEIPVTLLDDDANYATASEHKRGFYDETIVPRSDVLGEEINRQWLEPLGYEIEFAPEEMDMYQAEEAERAASLSQLVSAISTDVEIAKFSMAVLGYDLSDEQQTELDALIESKQAQKEKQDARESELAQARFGNVPAANTIQGKAFVVADEPDKERERAQFKRYATKHKDVKGFMFEHLDAEEQAALMRPFAIKAAPTDYESLRAEYRDAIAALLFAYVAGTLSASEFNAQAGALIGADLARAAHMGGMSQGGGFDQVALDSIVKAEIDNLQNAKADIAANGVDNRAELYGRTMDATYSRAAMDAIPNPDTAMLTFVGIDGQESCATCQKLKGQVHPLSWWNENLLVPAIGNTNFDCGGWKCQHYLQDVNGDPVTIGFD